MKGLYIGIVVAVLLAVRISLFRRRQARRRSEREVNPAADNPLPIARPNPRPAREAPQPEMIEDRNGFGDVKVIALREIRQRVQGRIFRIGTLIILLAVAAAIIIPKLNTNNGVTTQTVGVVGGLSPELRQIVDTAGSQNDDSVRLVAERSLAAATTDVRTGKTDLAILHGNEILLNQTAAASSSPADPSFVEAVADYLGVANAYKVAGLTPSQARQVANARSIPVRTLQAASKSATHTPSVIGIVFLFLMLQQYCTWILIGVMQEKSSRVVEVLLATVRPIQLLGGKVLGIGLVALAQAITIVGFALVLSAAVGSDLLHGTGLLLLLSELLWLVLGYAFYCWMYAAAGSLAERQDQVQTLALPLSIPILFGYVISITAASSGNAGPFFKVLAYLPPTAPFCMSVLVGLGQVAWWQFVASALLSVAGTVGMAVFAAGIYRRAVLRTGGKVRIRELFAHTARVS